MRHTSSQAATGQVWQQARLRLRRLRDWPGNAGNPYSPAFSIGLLLIIALASHIGR
ncbi:hypothetical protein [Bradyrhizobium sp.]|uniref:hypothetical protein n=1 Tax=Bradyrhizobium sp. TaxID=376 RepID=UPI003C71D205